MHLFEYMKTLTHLSTAGVVNALIRIHEDSDISKYSIKEIEEKELEDMRNEVRCLDVGTIDGSSTFRVMVFEPGHTIFKAATRLCICEICKNEYGSCSLFKEYSLPSISIISLSCDQIQKRELQ